MKDVGWSFFISENHFRKGGINLKQENFKLQCDILKKDDEKRIVYGKVLVPNKIDKQYDVIEPEEVERVAHEFLIGFQNPSLVGMVEKSEMGYQHQYIGNQDLYVVESWIDKSDGAWWLGTYVKNDDIWEGVKKGDITGYSIGGKAYRVPVEIAEP